MRKRKIYLNNTPLEDAQELFFERMEKYLEVAAGEKIPVEDSIGRVSLNAVFAKVSCPHYNAAAMDGIAVKAQTTFGASEKNAVLLEEHSQFIYVNTGDVIPQEFNAVIKIEEVVQEDEHKIRIIKSAIPWQHIRSIGEDIAAGEMIIPSKHMISPIDMGAMLAGGITEVEVYKKPRVGIIPTGTELVEPGSGLGKGNIIDFNSRIFMGMIEEWGGLAIRHPIIKDDFESIKQSISSAVKQNDIVIVSAGSSAGSKDFTANAIEELGEVLIHGIAVQPGKPAVLGIIGNKPVIGVPGYPVSAYLVMNFFIKPMIYKMTGRTPKPLEKIQAVSSRKLVSSIEYDEFVRVKIGSVGDKLIATPLSRGAGVVMSLVRADGFLKIPRNCEGYEVGQLVDIILMRDKEDILNTAVVIGSHDPIIDILADFLHRKCDKYTLSSSHVGSMGGIMALKRGETHMAGVHLLDPEDGSYNVSYIRKYLKNEEIALLHLVKRTQGFMVKKGNPLGIKDFDDLARENIRFINRQKGSGTRMLLDYYLNMKGISADKINGYTREEFTHLTTAAAVAEGSADTALGIYSAAIALDLDFIPVCDEQYDIAIPTRFLEQDILKQVIEIIKSDEFKEKVMSMGGYDVSQTGEFTILNSGDIL
jgi:putative molybdopterin biosynthesis protein